MTGGLGWDDIYPDDAEPAAIQNIYGSNGIYTKYIAKVAAHYAAISPEALKLSANGTRHEPHVAEMVLLEMLAEAGVTDIRYSVHLIKVDKVAAAIKDAAVNKAAEAAAGIESIVITTMAAQQPTYSVPPVSQQRLNAKRFVDATYTGDLMAAAGAPYTMGREGRREYGELNAGVVFTDGTTFLQGTTGISSNRIPAMSWRMCFTTNSSNRLVMDSPPAGYNRSTYLGYVDDVAAGRAPSVFSVREALLSATLYWLLLFFFFFSFSPASSSLTLHS